MFDIFPHLLSSIASFLFPLFASYKALKTSDPKQLAPWLTYWVVMSIFVLFESWTDWILCWIPLYAYFRLFFHLYLILPQTQGSKRLYRQYIEPWIAENENDIDMFIATAHDRLRAAGMQYLKLAIEWARVNILHLPPDETLNAQAAAPPAQQAPQSYITSLLARFTAEPGTAPPPPPPQSGWGATGTDFYSMLAKAVTTATGYGSSSAQPTTPVRARSQSQDMTASGTLIPENLREAHPNDQLTFLSAQRERLQILMGALDREAASLQVPGAYHSSGEPTVFTPGSTVSHASSSRPASGLSKSRSETDFEKIDAESGAEDERAGFRKRGGNPRQGSTGWMPWSVGGGGDSDEGLNYGGRGGRSTGYDPSD